MYPLLIEERVNEHRRDLQHQADRAAMVRAAQPSHRRDRQPRESMGRRLGVLLIRSGGRLVAHRRPDPAPCPWCDLAFPQPVPPQRVPAPPAVTGPEPDQAGAYGRGSSREERWPPAQATQVVVDGRAARRSSPMGRPQSPHRP